ncbi:hypothetical protein KFE25_013726 [Diacronema lutheri]|uniref:PPM-type phosphatase domain-containing protein n=1 Tax=Diacronema lutheri TaxID=2081491 RepID=A0A8J5XNT9_DIALT|nr:hypothetical protein KFE25_013726 [Diacronema lutheri]
MLAEVSASLVFGIIALARARGLRALVALALEALHLLDGEAMSWLLGRAPSPPATALAPCWLPSAVPALPPSGSIPQLVLQPRQPPPPPPPTRPPSLQQARPPPPCLLPPAPALAASRVEAHVRVPTTGAGASSTAGAVERSAERVLQRAFLRLDAELLGADRHLAAKAAARADAATDAAKSAHAAAEAGADVEYAGSLSTPPSGGARASVRSLLPSHSADHQTERARRRAATAGAAPASASTRVEESGGWVLPDGRVIGLLRTSRALGDGAFKSVAQTPADQQPIIARPEVVCVPLPHAHCARTHEQQRDSANLGLAESLRAADGVHKVNALVLRTCYGARSGLVRPV